MFERTRTLAGLAFCLATLGACADAHWDSVRWPSERPGLPEQPRASVAEIGLGLRLVGVDYEPEGIVVFLELENFGNEALQIETEAVLLRWVELEYPVDGPGDILLVEPGLTVTASWGYRLGRPLTGAGATMVFRSLTHAATPVLEPPTIGLPPRPVVVD